MPNAEIALPDDVRAAIENAGFSIRPDGIFGGPPYLSVHWALGFAEAAGVSALEQTLSKAAREGAISQRHRVDAVREWQGIVGRLLSVIKRG